MVKAMCRTAEASKAKASAKPGAIKRRPAAVKRRPAASRPADCAEAEGGDSSPDCFHLCQLVIRLLGSPLPRPPPEVAYLFQQLDQNVDSVVGAAVRLLTIAPDTKLFLLDIDNDKLGVPISSNYGATALLLQKLEAAGISRSCIELGSFDHSGMIHTLVEARSVVQHAKARGWQSLAVLAPSFHLPRAAMTLASEAMREYPDLRLYPFAGDNLPWHERAQHSQGMVGVRSDFIKSELDRIVRYTNTGDIATWTSLWNLFDSSDAASDLPPHIASIGPSVVRSWEERVQAAMSSPPWGQIPEHLCAGMVIERIRPMVADIKKHNSAFERLQLCALLVKGYIRHSRDGDGVGLGLREGCAPVDQECCEICKGSWQALKKFFLSEPAESIATLKEPLRECQESLNYYVESSNKYGGNKGYAVLTADIDSVLKSL